MVTPRKVSKLTACEDAPVCKLLGRTALAVHPVHDRERLTAGIVYDVALTQRIEESAAEARNALQHRRSLSMSERKALPSPCRRKRKDIPFVLLQKPLPEEVCHRRTEIVRRQIAGTVQVPVVVLRKDPEPRHEPDDLRGVRLGKYPSQEILHAFLAEPAPYLRSVRIAGRFVLEALIDIFHTRELVRIGFGKGKRRILLEPYEDARIRLRIKDEADLVVNDLEEFLRIVRPSETRRRGIVTGHRGAHHTDGEIPLLYDLPVVIEALLVGF